MFGSIIGSAHAGSTLLTDESYHLYVYQLELNVWSMPVIAMSVNTVMSVPARTAESGGHIECISGQAASMCI